MKERTRDEFRMMWFEDWFRDIRYSVRALRRATWFTAVSSLMLAIGIGSATAVFSVINSVLLQPLPYPRADSLVTLQHVAPGANLTDVPMASTQFYTYRKENKTFEQLGLWQKGVSSVTGKTQPEEVQSLQVTAGTLQTLGVAPLVGRWFSEEDDTPGTPETVVLAHAYWQRRFGGDRSILGQTLTIDARPRQVIAVMPDRFRFLNDDIDVILPFRFDRGQLILRKPAYQGIARLKPGVTLAQANTDVARMLPMWIKGWPCRRARASASSRAHDSRPRCARSRRPSSATLATCSGC